MEKSALEDVYRKHHERGKRYGYLYCHGARVPFLKDWIGQGKKVLDLGCRDGVLTEAFTEGNEVVGVDIDQKALEMAKNRLNIKTLWLDLNREWPFEQESFDVIVACELMEHLFLMEAFLEKVKAALKKGGIFIGSVPNAFRVRNRFKFLCGNEYDTDPTHVRQFSYEKLEKVLNGYFSEVLIVPIEGRFLPFVQVFDALPQRIRQLFAKDLLWRAIK